ncbi:MAG: hypothetical protein ACI8YQ_004199 [Polaribacter sp.]|jgi:hypothetical protein
MKITMNILINVRSKNNLFTGVTNLFQSLKNSSFLFAMMFFFFANQGNAQPGSWAKAKLSTKVVKAKLPVSKRASIENLPVCDIQLVVKTATRDDSGTDDKMSVVLNKTRYFLDYGRDDFEKGKTHSYYLFLPEVRKVSDIKKLEIRVHGDDGWIVQSIQLKVNNMIIYDHKFKKPHTIDRNNSKYKDRITCTGKQLRQNAYWNLKNKRISTRPPGMISNATLVSMFESMIGDQLGRTSKLVYGRLVHSKYVEGRTLNSKKMTFDLDLEYKKYGPNNTVDVDFDLFIKVINGKLYLEGKNLRGKVYKSADQRVVDGANSVAGFFKKYGCHAAPFVSGGTVKAPECASVAKKIEQVTKVIQDMYDNYSFNGNSLEVGLGISPKSCYTIRNAYFDKGGNLILKWNKKSWNSSNTMSSVSN